MRHRFCAICHESDLERVTEEIANLARVPIEITVQVLEEYHQMMAAQEFIAVGGQDVAIRLLVKAFGENGAKNMVQQLTQAEESPSFKSDALKKGRSAATGQIPGRRTSPNQGLGPRHLDAKQASALLMNLEPGSARRLCQAAGDNGTAFRRKSHAKVSTRAEPPLEIRGRSEQAGQTRSQESCRTHEPP